MAVIDKIMNCGLVPVIVLDKVENALPLAEAMLKGGVDVAEITFRTDAADESVRLITEKYPEMLVGAGTILTLDQLERAHKAGVKFVVSPGFDPKIVKRCKELDLLVIPGGVTPSEIIKIMNEGLDIVKFFPAGYYGGLKCIKTLSAPFGNLKFLPTGGIGPDNLKEYYEFDKVVAVGGSWMVDRQLINDGRFDEITKLCKEAKEIYNSVR